MKTKVYTNVRRRLADTTTPVTAYLNIRDHFTYACLLESNDFRASENSMSIVGFDPLSSFSVSNGQATIKTIAGTTERHNVSNGSLVDLLNQYYTSFEVVYHDHTAPLNGIVGHTNFDAIQYFETIKFPQKKRIIDIPDLHYIFYRYYIIFNHFNEELFLIENNPASSNNSDLDKIERLIFRQSPPTYSFKITGEETSNITDEAYKELVRVGKHHCKIGDVFQIVLSRQYVQEFEGDDFMVYRVLRSINPSPYLFYFDFGAYKIFGSSPESQLVIQDGIARVNPIAGTYRRTGIDDEDAQKAAELAEDPKEVAEHIMLVDLARNDLGRHCDQVKIEELKEIQYFSHVIHLVSKVTGRLTELHSTAQVFGDTFPAGTLSGAPKYKAIELINQYENQNRAIYGGAIGFVDFAGNMNKAIIIRSFLSRDNKLYAQAGAGIVNESNEENELQEVNNKLGALKKAIQQATQLVEL